ncbi:hypothetical protein J1C54_08255 [Alcanivorax sp. 1008]|nr:hypothetical protein [Alcanivorax sp. 1008]
MNNSPSYWDLRDRESMWVEITPFRACSSEETSAEEDENSHIIFRANVTDVKEGHKFPFKDINLTINMVGSNNAPTGQPKYPAGNVILGEDHAHFILQASPERLSRIVSCLGFVRTRSVTFYIEMPPLPDDNLPVPHPINHHRFIVTVGND